jgi:serine/threonine-protein kinase
MTSLFTDEGTILAGKYRVDRVLGQGGMGIVVKATHLQLEQPVALKFLQPRGMENPAIVARFAREAKALAKLKSDHVAHVSDVGNLESGAPYIVMEYLDGEDLASLLDRRGPLSIDEAVGYVLQACEGMAEAHEARIVHRDLKPANLFLATSGDGSAPVVKVLDFGIAKALDDDTAGALTKTSSVFGSAYYMAPEQMRNAKACDERTDVWALGVILYELLTGRVPFEGESVHQVVAAVLEKNRLAVHALRPDVPRELEAVIDRALVNDPAARTASVLELARGLLPFAPQTGASLVRIRRSPGIDAQGAGTGHAPTGSGAVDPRVALANARTEVATGPIPSSDVASAASMRRADGPAGTAPPVVDGPRPAKRSGAVFGVVGGALLIGLSIVGYRMAAKPSTPAEAPSSTPIRASSDAVPSASPSSPEKPVDSAQANAALDASVAPSLPSASGAPAHVDHTGRPVKTGPSVAAPANPPPSTAQASAAQATPPPAVTATATAAATAKPAATPANGIQPISTMGIK